MERHMIQKVYIVFHSPVKSNVRTQNICHVIFREGILEANITLISGITVPILTIKNNP